ncbi:MAG: hypothetical protein QM791_07115 [Ferruginibacter sp.]
MNSELEKFVNKNRGQFDTEEPAEAVWKTIESKLPQAKNAKLFSLKQVYKWVAAAAVICIALTSVYFIYIHKGKPDISRGEKPSTNSTEPANDLEGISPEYAAEAKQVYKAIEVKQQELKAVTADQPALYQQFLGDLRVLDSSYRMLQNQALQTPNQDVIVKAMLQNLQLQMELLGRQLMIMNEIKNKKTQQNEKTI